MSNDERKINPIELSLLTDLVGLYTCDLSREYHQYCDESCIACSKEAIIAAIQHYRKLDASVEILPAAPASLLIVPDG